MLTYQHAEQILADAELIHSEQVVNDAVHRLATDITDVLANKYPLVLCVMGGAVVFTGQLLPLLRFPLDFDYLQVSRYHNETHGGELNWQVEPQKDLNNRVVLVLDDILDEGVTLSAIRKKVMDCGARTFYSAVLADKVIDKPKPLHADFVGLTLPNRYVFGFGMDVQGTWRNLPAIYAIKN